MADFEPAVYSAPIASGLLATLPSAPWISALMSLLAVATTRYLPALRVYEAR